MPAELWKNTETGTDAENILNFFLEKDAIIGHPLRADFEKTGRNTARLTVHSESGQTHTFTINRMSWLPSAILMRIWGATWFSQEELWGEQPEGPSEHLEDVPGWDY